MLTNKRKLFMMLFMNHTEAVLIRERVPVLQAIM